jgi:hypothetical protein
MLEGGTTGVRPDAEKRNESGAAAPNIAGQRDFGVFATALSFDGFGLGVRGGSRIGLDASFGWSPIVATWVPNGSHDIHFKVLSSLQFNASVFWAFYRASARSDLGILITYKYNTLVQHGVGAAFYAQYDLAEHWALHFFVGPAIFPAAEDRIRREAGWPSDGLLSSGLSWLEGGIGVAIACFP